MATLVHKFLYKNTVLYLMSWECSKNEKSVKTKPVEVPELSTNNLAFQSDKKLAKSPKESYV